MHGGRQRQESTRTTSKRVAEKMLSIRLAEIAEGRFRMVASNPPSLEKWADEFLESVRVKSTKKRYSSSVMYLKNSFGQARISEITPNLIEEHKASRLKSGVGPATVNRDLAVLRRMLNLAARRRLIGQNPFMEVDFLNEKDCRKQPHILTYEEQKRITAVATTHLRAMIVLITETGLRVDKEALQLKWTDVDLEDSHLTVRDSKTRAGRRIVPLSELCRGELTRWRSLIGPEYSEYVFPNMDTPAKHLRSIRTTWLTALKNAGLPLFAIYNLRHTFASRLNASGVSGVTIAHLLGHAGPGIVQTYAKVLDDTRRDAIKQLEKYAHSQLTLPIRLNEKGQ